MMNRRYSLPVHFSTYITILIGIALFSVKNFLSIEGEWGIEDHYLVKPLTGLHLLTTPFLIFFVGSIFHFHIYLKLKHKTKELRPSGYLLIFSFVLMAFSGISIQILMSAEIRETSVKIHNVATFSWIIFYGVHHFNGRKTK